MADRLKGIQDLFSLLSLSIAKLNSILSIPILYVLLSRIIVGSVSLFQLTTSTICFTSHIPKRCGTSFIYLMVERFIPSIVLIGVILTAAELPVKEVLISNLIL